MIYKIILLALLLMLMTYISQWCFNHVDAWLGIGIGAATAIFFIILIFNNVKKHIE